MSQLETTIGDADRPIRAPVARTQTAAWFAGGVAVAFVVAVLIARIPPDLLVAGSLGLACLYVLTAGSGVVAVVVTYRRFHLRGEELRRRVNAALCGALLFDGVMIGFAPELYGHRGEPLAMAAAGLLWGVFCFGAVGAIVSSQTHD